MTRGQTRFYLALVSFIMVATTIGRACKYKKPYMCQFNRKLLLRKYDACDDEIIKAIQSFKIDRTGCQNLQISIKRMDIVTISQKEDKNVDFSHVYKNDNSNGWEISKRFIIAKFFFKNHAVQRMNPSVSVHLDFTSDGVIIPCDVLQEYDVNTKSLSLDFGVKEDTKAEFSLKFERKELERKQSSLCSTHTNAVTLGRIALRQLNVALQYEDDGGDAVNAKKPTLYIGNA